VALNDGSQDFYFSVACIILKLSLAIWCFIYYKWESNSIKPLKMRNVMKENTHPAYHEINVILTDGTKVKMRTTWGKPGDTMTLEIDSLSHPAYTGQHRVISSNQGNAFENRFGGLKF
jgi:large subunit ribosomal protein L31